MDKPIVEIRTEEAFHRLQQEITEMELSTKDAIAELELQLGGLESMDDGWSSRLDTIEIYAMEEAPSLRESIRKICPVPV